MPTSLYVSPYASHIGRTMGEIARLTADIGQARAAGILGRGQAQSRAQDIAGRAQAQSLYEQGDISANMWRSLGQIASGVGQEYLRRQEPGYQLDQMALEDARRERADQTAITDALRRAARPQLQGPPVPQLEGPPAPDLMMPSSRGGRTLGEIGGPGMLAESPLTEEDLTFDTVQAAIRDLEASGEASAAGRLRTQVGEWQKQSWQAARERTSLLKDRYELASQLLSGVPDATNPADAYARALPQIRNWVGPQVASFLPETYDAASVREAIDWGRTASEKLEAMRLALDKAKLNAPDYEDLERRDAYHTEALGIVLSAVDSQEEWDAMIKGSREIGALDATIDKFGPTYSEKAVARAKALSGQAQPSKSLQRMTGWTREGKDVLLGWDPNTNLLYEGGNTTTPVTLDDYEQSARESGRLAPSGLTQLVNSIERAPEFFYLQTATYISQLLESGQLSPELIDRIVAARAPDGPSEAQIGQAVDGWRRDINALEDRYAIDRNTQTGLLPTARQKQYEADKAALDQLFRFRMGETDVLDVPGMPLVRRPQRSTPSESSGGAQLEGLGPGNEYQGRAIRARPPIGRPLSQVGQPGAPSGPAGPPLVPMGRIGTDVGMEPPPPVVGRPSAAAGPGPVRVQLPNGDVAEFPDQATADAYRRQYGIP